MSRKSTFTTLCLGIKPGISDTEFHSGIHKAKVERFHSWVRHRLHEHGMSYEKKNRIWRLLGDWDEAIIREQIFQAKKQIKQLTPIK